MLIAFEMKSDKWIILFGTHEKLVTVTQELPWKFLMIPVWSVTEYSLTYTYK